MGNNQFLSVGLGLGSVSLRLIITQTRERADRSIVV